MYSVYEDHAGTLWVGTFRGLNQLIAGPDGKSAFVQYHHNPADSSTISAEYVTSFVEDDAGRLWVGTDDGLNRFDPVKKKFFIPGILGVSATTPSILLPRMIKVRCGLEPLEEESAGLLQSGSSSSTSCTNRAIKTL